MRMIGTFSSAIGFIFLGVWMIIERSNPQLGDTIFKWWPLIIIVLGIEVLMSFSKEKEFQKKPGFNGLIILVIGIFLFVNMFGGAFRFVSKGFDGISLKGVNLDGIVNLGESFDSHNYREIKTQRTLKEIGKGFSFEADSAVINLYKTSGNSGRIDAKVYVDKNSDVKNYSIKVDKNSNGTEVILNESYIRKVSVDLYLPDNLLVKLTTDSASIKGRDSFKSSSFELDGDSGNVELKGGTRLDLELSSGIIKVNDIKDVKIQADSGTINLNGDVRNVDASLDSGTFNLDNQQTEAVAVDMSSGILNIKTAEKNLDVDVTLDSGICSVNGDKRVNSGLTKSYGSGKNKLKVNMSSGTIKISSQE